MMDGGLSDISVAFRYSTLATKISKGLRRNLAGKPLDGPALAALGRGSKLIRQMVCGSSVVSTKAAGFAGEGASRDTLRAFRHALSALQHLPAEVREDLTATLHVYEEDAGRLADGESLPDSRLQELVGFFEALSESFSAEIKVAGNLPRLDPLFRPAR